MKKTKLLTLLILNVVGTIAMIVINYLSIVYPFNGKTQKEISDMFFTLITPAGITFSIWGLIYFLLVSFIIYQIILFIKGEIYPIEKIGIWYFLSCIFNISWIFAWSYIQIEISLIIVLLLFLSLAITYNRIGIGKQTGSTIDYVFMYIPFSVYFAWVSVATVLNISVFLVKLNWNGFGIPYDVWGFVVILTLVCLISYNVITRNDIFFGLTTEWALFGILLERLKNIESSPLTLSGVIAGLVIIFTLIVYKIIKRKVYF